MKLCLAMPVYNEEENIEVMVKRFRKVFPKIYLFVVDQHSTDKTQEIARRLNIPLYQRDGKGYGAGVRKIIEIASKKGFDTLAILDCDQTYAPEELPKLIKFIPEYDFVIGIRNPKTYHPRLHWFGNLLHTTLANILFFSNLKDINSGMWVIKPAKFYGKLDANGMDFTMQMNTTALKNKYKIKQVPISYTKRVGDAKIRFSDGVKNALRIITERFR